MNEQHGMRKTSEGGCVCLLRVDGDDLTSATTHEEDSIETLSQDLKELHVCKTTKSKSTTSRTGQKYSNNVFPLSQSAQNCV